MIRFIKTALKTLFVIGALGSVTAAAVLVWGYREFTGPGPLTSEKTVIVAKGAGIIQIARQLEREGVISRADVFQYGTRLLGESRPPKVGEYKFGTASSQRQVLNKILEGDTVIRKFTVLEGETTFMVLEKLDKAEGLEGVITISVREGELLPETYFYSWGDARNSMVERMRSAMQKTLDELWEKRAADLPYKTRREALIMASIVEKETSVDREYPIIAGVFINRMRIGMKLQTDPTVIYGITNGERILGRGLKRSELKGKTAYNTYVIDGLPPGPISNPGKMALQAAMNPENTKYLYFVANGRGGHHFAKTGKEHLRNVAKWRVIEKGIRKRKRK